MANYGGGAPARYTRNRKKKPSRVSSVVEQRTAGRLKALEGDKEMMGALAGKVNASDGISRKEAQVVLKARRTQKAYRRRTRTAKRYASSPYNPANNPNSPFA